MSVFSRLLKIGGRTLDGAPRLAPWYFSESQPQLRRNGVLLAWKFMEKMGTEFVGVLMLEGQAGECLGLVKTYTYLLPGPGNETFLVWSRYHPKAPRTLEISLYKSAQLQPIEHSRDSALALRDDKDVSFRFDGEREGYISFAGSNDGEHDFRFPEPFKAFDDFCVVDALPGVYGSDDPKWQTECIIRFCPKGDKVAVYPQDWFNKADMDFGYQWITRAAIDKRSGRIHGQGIRLNSFVLDKTGRNLKRWWSL